MTNTKWCTAQIVEFDTFTRETHVWDEIRLDSNRSPQRLLRDIEKTLHRAGRPKVHFKHALTDEDGFIVMCTEFTIENEIFRLYYTIILE